MHIFSPSSVGAGCQGVSWSENPQASDLLKGRPTRQRRLGHTGELDTRKSALTCILDGLTPCVAASAGSAPPLGPPPAA